MVNQSIFLGKFPDSLKIAYIIPIFKKGDLREPSNYRPISILPFLSKIFERILYVRLLKFFCDKSIITPFQFGFTKNKSTLDAIMNLTESLYDTLNSKQNSLNVFIDYSKAFDTVNHSILLRKLDKYGIRGAPLDLISNYLKNRKQIVRINQSFSSSKIIKIGIPQGSILGPLLFLIYVNDLPNLSEIFSSTLFADDTTLTFKGSDLTLLTVILNDELNKFKAWSDSNRLTVNVEKTNCLLVTNLANPVPFNNILLDNQPLNFVDQIGFLGITLDKNLKFDAHIRFICNKVSKSIGILFRIKHLVPNSCLKTLYYSIIHPYFLYCLPVWGCAYNAHLYPLVVLQKKAIRILSGASYLEHTNPLFLSNRILKLQDLYTFSIANYTYKNPHILFNFSRSHTYDTRNRESLLPPFERLCTTQQSVLYNAARIWNMLPPAIKTSKTLYTFKTRLKSHLLQQYAVDFE